MSKIKLQGNDTGTGVFTVSSPASNTNRSITLPDEAGEILLATGDGSSLTGLSGGLDEVDMWELPSSLSVATQTNTYPTGWARVGHDGAEKIGTGLSHSSGVFTFPSTGYYLINFNACFERNSNNTDYTIGVIETTTNGSSYSDAAAAYCMINSPPVYDAISMQFLFKVTNTSTHKLRFKIFAEAPVTLQGDSGVSFTSFTSMKLGDV